jgi:hypothetical protein
MLHIASVGSREVLEGAPARAQYVGHPAWYLFGVVELVALKL